MVSAPWGLITSWQMTHVAKSSPPSGPVGPTAAAGAGVAATTATRLSAGTGTGEATADAA